MKKLLPIDPELYSTTEKLVELAIMPETEGLMVTTHDFKPLHDTFRQHLVSISTANNAGDIDDLIDLCQRHGVVYALFADADDAYSTWLDEHSGEPDAKDAEYESIYDRLAVLEEEYEMGVFGSEAVLAAYRKFDPNFWQQQEDPNSEGEHDDDEEE